MNLSPVYLDYAATTPCAPEVVTRMLPYFTEKFGNAASNTHAYGWIAEEAVKQSREIIAGFIGADAKEIVFTSGATESINLAIKGTWEVFKTFGNHIITCQTEHKAVLDTCNYLEKQGAAVTYLPVDQNGLIDPAALEMAVKPETILIAIMLVNNETGVIQPVEAIAEIAQKHNIYFFCDATQAFGKMPLDVIQKGIDIMSISAHKIYGPKGTGALYVRRKSPRVKLAEQINGGGHENGLRSGTLNVPGIVGLGEAVNLCRNNMSEDTDRIGKLKKKLEDTLVREYGCEVNGAGAPRIGGICNISFPGITGERLIAAIHDKVACSVGSACTSAVKGPSHVLSAMNLPQWKKDGALRFSLGRPTTEQEILQAIAAIREKLNKRVL